MRIGTGTVHKAFDKKTGLADPFVQIGETFTVGWDFKSKICRNTLTPEWCESGSFERKRLNGASIKLAIEMIDYDPGLLDMNDFIGRAEIDGIAGFYGALNLNGKDGTCYGTIHDLNITSHLVDTKRIPIYATETHVEHGHSYDF